MKTLDPDLLLRAYSIGVFPMSDSRDAGDLYWVEPRRRAVLPLNSFHLSRSLRKKLKSDVFEVTHDRAFAEIVRLCAEREDTWINAEIEASYIRLHEAGRAHSIEVWQDGALAGGPGLVRPVEGDRKEARAARQKRLTQTGPRPIFGR